MSKRTNIYLDTETFAILEHLPRSFNLSDFVRQKLKELHMEENKNANSQGNQP